MEPNLAELRAWSAGVCGYRLWDGRAWVLNKSGECIGYKHADWLPDQNIAQAMELLEAINAGAWSLDKEGHWYSCSLELKTELGHLEFRSGAQRSACMAIVLACHA